MKFDVYKKVNFMWQFSNRDKINLNRDKIKELKKN